MARQTRDRASSAADAAIDRIRNLNERIMESVRHGGDQALEAYERTASMRSKTVLRFLCRRS